MLAEVIAHWEMKEMTSPRQAKETTKEIETAIITVKITIVVAIATVIITMSTKTVVVVEVVVQPWELLPHPQCEMSYILKAYYLEIMKSRYDERSGSWLLTIAVHMVYIFLNWFMMEIYEMMA
jgi:hypothetical protein